MNGKVNTSILTGVIAEAIVVLFWILAGTFKNQEAATWPRFILVIVALLSALLIIRGVRENSLLTINFSETAYVLIGVLAMIVYAILMQFTGFFISTAIFLPIAMAVLGQKNWLVLIGVTAGMELFVWFLFVYELKLRMP